MTVSNLVGIIVAVVVFGIVIYVMWTKGRSKFKDKVIPQLRDLPKDIRDKYIREIKDKIEGKK
jgi:hypothetical protein